jgi:hypothetical protein
MGNFTLNQSGFLERGCFSETCRSIIGAKVGVSLLIDFITVVNEILGKTMQDFKKFGDFLKQEGNTIVFNI